MSKPDLSYIAEDLRQLAVPIDTIREDPKNARLHNDANLQQIAESYRLFGQRKPIVINKRTGGISEDGSGQLCAARDILKWKYIAIVQVDDDEETAIAYSIAANKSGESSAWNDDVLIKQLASLSEDLRGATGFSEEEINELSDFKEFWEDEKKADQDTGVGVYTKEAPPIVKVAVDVEQLDIVERAIRSTGEKHRGRALLLVCEAYLNGREETI